MLRIAQNHRDHHHISNLYVGNVMYENVTSLLLPIKFAGKRKAENKALHSSLFAAPVVCIVYYC